jgi:hypothetical protein
MLRTPTGVTKAIDELYRIRAERKMLEAKEEQLGNAIKNYMKSVNLVEVETREHRAIFSTRIGGAIDPEAYYDVLDDFDKFIETVIIRKETNKEKGLLGADRYLGKEEIENITIPTETPVLRIVRLNKVESPNKDKESNKIKEPSKTKEPKPQKTPQKVNYA